jgi:predicted ATPase with chaperone activity
MTLPEAIGTSRIQHVAGLTGERTVSVTTHPFRTLHHIASNVRLMHGEVVWAHYGFRTYATGELTRPTFLRSMAYEPPRTIMPSRAGSSRFPG